MKYLSRRITPENCASLELFAQRNNLGGKGTINPAIALLFEKYEQLAEENARLKKTIALLEKLQ